MDQALPPLGRIAAELAGRRVLVTGGSGFLGRSVCRLLDMTGVEDLVAPTHADYDLTEQSAVRALLAETRPDVIIHLAAEVGGIAANRDNPGRFFYANMAMGLNLIEEARLRGVAKLVQVGTVCSYPKQTPVPFSESDLWNGYPEETNAPYGIAKKALLVMLEAYESQYGMSSAFLLPANLYGPGDNLDPSSGHVVAALIRKCEEARAAGADHIVCWGTGSASRDFLYVDDCAEAVVRATAFASKPEPINVGSGREVTIAELVELIAGATGFHGEIRWNRDQSDGQPRRCLGTERAEAVLGFRAATSLAEGLDATVAWYRAAAAAEVVVAP